jgi:hypothetical protein
VLTFEEKNLMEQTAGFLESWGKLPYEAFGPLLLFGNSSCSKPKLSGISLLFFCPT